MSTAGIVPEAGRAERAGLSAAVATDPLRFAAEALELEGALVEAGDGCLDALLPLEVARSLGWDEEVRLAPRVAEREGEERIRAIGYGSKDLEVLVERVRERGAISCRRWDAPMTGHRDVAMVARQRLRFRTRGPISFAPATSPMVSYLTVHYGVTVLSEESHEMLVGATINEGTLGPVPGLAAGVSRLDPRPKPGGREAATGPWLPAQVLAAAGREAGRAALDQTRPFLAAMERRRLRDLERLHSYYESLAREAARPRRGHQPARVTAEERFESIRGEYQRKALELEHRYALRVRLRPATVERLTLQVWQSLCQLRWKRAERAVPVIWNPVLRDLEPLPCDRCGVGAWELAVGMDLALQCARCAETGGLGGTPAC